MSQPSSADAPWPVRTVARKIGEWIARLGEVWVEGQLTQLSTRGNTCYLVLRDPAADISLSVTCRRDVLGDPVAEGARLIVRGRADFFLGRGTLSLRAAEVRRVGVGELLARLQRLQQLLAAEGLFDPARKRRLPFLPQGVGLVTGRASAAERDVVAVSRQRWPGVRVRVLNCAVQGPHAAAEVIEAVRRLDRDPDIDVIVIARGGGSVEDLLPFSDESLVRAVASCRTPVISAIGHEPDTPLLDLVADVRAATPTDAAKRAVPDVADELQRVRQLWERARRATGGLLDREGQRLASLRSRPALSDPAAMVDGRRTDLDGLRQRARRSIDHRLVVATADVAHAAARVAALSPAATLARGYAVVQDAAGRVVVDPAAVAVGQALQVRLAEGRLAVRAD